MSQTTPIYPAFRPPTSDPAISLRLKVLAIVVAAVILATLPLLLYVFVVLDRDEQRVSSAQLDAYSRVIVDRLRLGAAEGGAVGRIVADLPCDVRIVASDGTSTTTSVDIPTLEQVTARFDRSDSIRFSSGRLVVLDGSSTRFGIRRVGDAVFIVNVTDPVAGSPFAPVMLLAMAVAILLLSGSWFAVAWLLRPVGELMQGVEAVGSGDFKYRVPVRSTDELGTLVSAFNAMSEQIDAIVESKRRLLFDVSHELRTPLTRMNIVISMLPEGKQKDRLARNASELATMITELLENERLAVLGAQLVVEEFDLVELARRVVDSFVDEADRIEFDTLTEELTVTADPQRLTVALRNVVSNALKYSDPSDPPVLVTVFPDDDGVRLVVRDGGIGISEDSLEAVFEPFYRTDESRTRTTGGYGLGLALTKSIVDAHGGTIRAESRLGKGTTITIWIPKSQARSAEVDGVQVDPAQQTSVHH